MTIKRKTKGGVIAIIGYILSPLSWWNDLIINIPLAYGFGVLFGLISENLFLPFMIIGYWMTNVLGLLMMHYGIINMFSKKQKKYTKKELIKHLFISLVYTLLIIYLIKMGWLQFPRMN